MTANKKHINLQVLSTAVFGVLIFISIVFLSVAAAEPVLATHAIRPTPQPIASPILASVGGGEATTAAATKGGLKETPQTGAGFMTLTGLVGVGTLGAYLSRHKKGREVFEKIEDNLGELGSIYVNLRSALKHNA